MKTIIFNFNLIRDMDDFYKKLQHALPLPQYFGYNLDALFDILTGDSTLPLKIIFTHLSPEQKERFFKLISTLEEVAIQTENFFFYTT